MTVLSVGVVAGVVLSALAAVGVAAPELTGFCCTNAVSFVSTSCNRLSGSASVEAVELSTEAAGEEAVVTA